MVDRRGGEHEAICTGGGTAAGVTPAAAGSEISRAAIHPQFAAEYVAGLIRCQIQGGVGQLLRRAHPSQRHQVLISSCRSLKGLGAEAGDLSSAGCARGPGLRPFTRIPCGSSSAPTGYASATAARFYWRHRRCWWAETDMGADRPAKNDRRRGQRRRRQRAATEERPFQADIHQSIPLRFAPVAEGAWCDITGVDEHHIQLRPAVGGLRPAGAAPAASPESAAMTQPLLPSSACACSRATSYALSPPPAPFGDKRLRRSETNSTLVPPVTSARIFFPAKRPITFS